jgi:lipoprotein-anchoring transpeptidase ErfK/SrfK
MLKNRLSRRAFLKLGGLALGGLAFSPLFPYQEEQEYGEIARVTISEIDLYSQPKDDATLIVGKRYRDQLVHIYYDLTSPDGPAYNPHWYRVWGGYLHSAYLQRVKVRLNTPLSQVPPSGQLCEVSVPFTQPYQYNKFTGWQPWGRPLYYETTHWATSVDAGPDGGQAPWYQITSEIDEHLIYYVPAAHLRPIPDEELTPLSPDVPPEKKRIEVSIARQTFTAYENDQPVYSGRISSGIIRSKPSPTGIPTATPRGRFRVFSKMPSKHMGSVSGNPDAESADSFSLPGVPWTCFFVNTGVALHGTYWHDNFGVTMSHGCVNLHNADAKWLFRWTTPVFSTPVESHRDWEKRGNGTVVIVE